MRYHSLSVLESSLPECIQPIAWSIGHHHAMQQQEDDGTNSYYNDHDTTTATSSDNKILMAIAHKTLPHYGVQFHPESIGTDHGDTLMRNFRDITVQYWAQHNNNEIEVEVEGEGEKEQSYKGGMALPPRAWHSDDGNCDVVYHKLPAILLPIIGSRITKAKASSSSSSSSEALFIKLFGDSEDDVGLTFWLDSSATDRGRFSYMGGVKHAGPLWRKISYKINGNSSSSKVGGGVLREERITASPSLWDGKMIITETNTTSFFDWLGRELSTYRCCISSITAADLPFDFWGGLVGYIGYELKAECGGQLVHTTPTQCPDASLFFTDRLVVVDHHHGDVYLVALYEKNDDGGERGVAEQWVRSTAERIHNSFLMVNGQIENGHVPVENLDKNHQISGGGVPSIKIQSSKGHATTGTVNTGRKAIGNNNSDSTLSSFTLRAPREQYLKNVRSCLNALYAGDSYELCLTTMFSRPHSVPSAWSLYKRLRTLNPAPYAAWLDFQGLRLMCSSPERFLKCGRGGMLEAKPIKGTASRHLTDKLADRQAAAALAASEKDRAENLMIVDLLRNDLGRVCDSGSVHVPTLMEVESHATVHQLVSTVRGRRQESVTIPDCLRAAFPGGSMTGAPKIRSMAILDELEKGPRGPYSGCIGFIALNDTFDLNIVIRTAIEYPSDDDGGNDNSRVLQVGAGGAIVVQSDPADEYDEMRLKAAVILQAIQDCDKAGEVDK